MAWVSFIYGFSGTVQSGPSLQLVSKVIFNLSLKAALVAPGPYIRGQRSQETASVGSFHQCGNDIMDFF